MKLSIINGPNLNMLGIREPEIYGDTTYEKLCDLLTKYAKEKNIDIDIFQSNHEGHLVDDIQSCYQNADGIIINPAAYTHTSVALLDALKAVDLPTIEVHLSEVSTREDFRQISYVRPACLYTITGKGIQGYMEAIDRLYNHLK